MQRLHRRRNANVLTDAQVLVASGTFQVLSDPTRLRIIHELLSGPKSVGALAIACDVSASAGLTVTSLLELAVALLSGSVALLADALHNLGDVFTTVGIYFGFRMSRRVATTRFPYGYGRSEDLAGVVVVAAIWISAGVAFYQSYEKLVSGTPTTDLTLGMAAAVIGIVGNQIVARYKSRVGREINSAPLIVDAKHSLLDSAASAGALVGLVGVALGFPQADPIAGFAIGLLIVHIGI